MLSWPIKKGQRLLQYSSWKAATKVDACTAIWEVKAKTRETQAQRTSTA
jgi:hypothetical protein